MKRRAPAVDEWDKVKVGHRIELLRLALGLQQNTLAAMMGKGMTPQKINNYESGRNQIPPHWVGRLCGVTGCNFDYVYHGSLKGLPDDLREKVAKVAAATARLKRA